MTEYVHVVIIIAASIVLLYLLCANRKEGYSQEEEKRDKRRIKAYSSPLPSSGQASQYPLSSGGASRYPLFPQNDPLVPDDIEENDEDELAGRGVESQRTYEYGYHLPTGSGIFPEAMYTRLRFPSPGFYSTNPTILALRPGIDYKELPQSRWTTKMPNQLYKVWNSHPVRAKPGEFPVEVSDYS